MAGVTKFIKKVCVQDALYWGSPEADGYGGVKYSQPRLVKCRWTDSTKTIMDDRGNLTACRAEVLVTEDMEVGGMLYLGDFTGITNNHRVNPISLSGAWMIKRVDRIPLFRSTNEFVRVVYL